MEIINMDCFFIFSLKLLTDRDYARYFGFWKFRIINKFFADV